MLATALKSVFAASLFLALCAVAGAQTFDKAKLDHLLDRLAEKNKGMGLVTFSFAGRTFYGNTGGGASSGSWLAYDPGEKLTIAYATNMKIHPVVDIVRGALDIYWNRPFEIPTFDSVEVSPEVLDQYVGYYSHPDAPAKARISRDGSTLFFQPPGASTAAPLEVTDQTTFKIEPGVIFEFDPEKNQMTIERRGMKRVFTKEN